MSALSLRLPNSIHEAARELARREGISINQLVATAVAEKMSALLTEEYFNARKTHASRGKFLAALGKVPNVEPASYDQLESSAKPNKAMQRTRNKPAPPKSPRARR